MEELHQAWRDTIEDGTVFESIESEAMLDEKPSDLADEGELSSGSTAEDEEDWLWYVFEWERKSRTMLTFPIEVGPV